MYDGKGGRCRLEADATGELGNDLKRRNQKSRHSDISERLTSAALELLEGLGGGEVAGRAGRGDASVGRVLEAHVRADARKVGAEVYGIVSSYLRWSYAITRTY